MRVVLLACALLTAGCGGVPGPGGSGVDTSCAGEPTRPITSAMLKRTLEQNGFTVRPDRESVICGGLGSADEEMPVELTNSLDSEVADREGTVFCGLRRGPIWGAELEKDLDAPASSPIFSGEKAEFSVANVECSVYPKGPRSGAQVRSMERVMEEIDRLAGG
jgi:hypothetical protein